jgi:hypothetical protein
MSVFAKVVMSVAQMEQWLASCSDRPSVAMWAVQKVSLMERLKVWKWALRKVTTTADQ